MLDPTGAGDVLPAGPVVVVDWNIGGHHELYLRAFTAGLRELGHLVVALCREPAQLEGDEAAAGAAPLVARAIPGLDWVKARRWFTRDVAERLFARRLAAILAEAESESGLRCTHVFIACIYERHARLVRHVVTRLGRNWSGLYLQAGVFHAGAGRPAGKNAAEVVRLLRQPGLDRLLMLDDGMAPRVAEVAGRPVVLVPDFADATTRDREPFLARLGLDRAGRPVVGLLGHLRPTKGVALLARLAVEHPEIEARFLFAGALERTAFSKEELGWIDRARAMSGRVFFHEGRVPDEAAYNALVRASDVLWAVYPNIPHSSNTLTKAALFERPVLVAEGHLMARQAREYRLGEVVPASDPVAVAAALRALLEEGEGWRARVRPRWEEFRCRQSRERLREALAGLSV